MPQRFALLDLQGGIVTIDARGCQKDIARTISQQHADDVVALQENHKASRRM